MSVIHLSYDSSGGASRAARRARLACQTVGIDASFGFANGDRLDELDLPLAPTSTAADTVEEAAALLLRDRMQWDFIARRRTALSKTLFSIAYPGVNLAGHPLIEAADIIHIHWPTWFITPKGIQAWLDAGKTVFWTLHDFWGMTGGCHYPAGCEQFETACMKCPQVRGDMSLVANAFTDKRRAYGRGGSLHIVAPSQWLTEHARKSKIFGGRSVTWTPNPIELDVFRPPVDRAELRRGFGVGKNDFVIFFGSLDHAEPRKGVGLLVEAIKDLFTTGDLPAALPAGAKIYLALTGKSIELPDIPRLSFLNFGRIDDDSVMADALGVSDVICIPSLEDNYPNVIVEGMACGTPSVGYATGGIAEMIDDKLTGVLARPVGSVAALRAALLHFAVSYLNDNDMRARCREVAERVNSLEVVGGQLKALYESALGRPIAERDPIMRRRTIRAFANTPNPRDVGIGRDFTQFPANMAMLQQLKNPAALAGFTTRAMSEAQGGARLISVRTEHVHHSAYSGPYQFLRHLSDDAYDCTHYSVPLGQELAGRMSALYSKGGAMIGMSAFGQQSNYWLAEGEILAQCASRPVEIVHYIDGEYGAWMLPRIPKQLYANGRRPRFVATYHQPPQILPTLVNLRSLAQLDAVIALCASQRDSLARLVEPERLFVIPHGVDTEFFHPDPDAKEPEEKERFTLLMVGHWLRDVDVALGAFETLKSSEFHFELRIVSPQFPASLNDPAITLLKGLTDEELREEYWSADLLYLPLLDATANNAVLEALACGLPVISTHVGGVPDAVGDDAGALCPVGDLAAFAEAVLSFARSPTRRAKARQAARRQAEKFSWRRIADMHHDLYQRILARDYSEKKLEAAQELLV